MDFAELVSFLNDPKAQVRIAATEGVQAYSETAEFIDHTKANPRQVLRPLLRLMEEEQEDAKKDGDLNLMATEVLVNLSAEAAIAEKMVELKAVGRAFDCMRRHVNKGTESYQRAAANMMLLSNLTTTSEGREDLYSDSGEKVGYILSLYLFFSLPEDPFRHLGNVLCNISHDEIGRKFLTVQKTETLEKHDLMAKLGNQVLNKRDRRPALLGIFRNLCVDKERHEDVAKSSFLPAVSCILYPENALEGLEGDNLEHAKKRQLNLPHVMKYGMGLTKDQTIRRAAMDCFSFLSRTATGREAMRAEEIYEVVRAWHRQEDDEEIGAMIDNLVPALVQTEEELMEEHRQEQEAEKRRQEAAAKAAEERAKAPQKPAQEKKIEEVTEEQAAEIARRQKEEDERPKVPIEEVKSLFFDAEDDGDGEKVESK